MWLSEFSYQFVSVSWELIWNQRRPTGERRVKVCHWHQLLDKYWSIYLSYLLEHQIVLSKLLSPQFPRNNQIIPSVCRLRKQNMCTVRGQLCIVSGSSRLLYKLWTSFGYAWAQMLCSMSQEHVRNGRLQVSNIALNFTTTWFDKQCWWFHCRSSSILLRRKQSTRNDQDLLKLSSIDVSVRHEMRKLKQKHKRLLFSNKSWNFEVEWEAKGTRSREGLLPFSGDEVNWKVFFFHSLCVDPSRFCRRREREKDEQAERGEKSESLMDSQIKIYVIFVFFFLGKKG